MADIRINSLPTTAVASSSDDFLALDGTTNGTRKLNAYSPTFGGNLTVNGTASAGTLTDGYIMVSAAQINRASNFVELQYAASGGVRMFGNTATPITFSSAGNLTVGGTGTSTFAGTLSIPYGGAFNAYSISLAGTNAYGVLAIGTASSIYQQHLTNDTYIDSSNGAKLVLMAGNSGELRLAGRANSIVTFYTSNTEVGRFTTTGNLLLGTTTDSSNGKVQLATHTTSAGGIGFGTDTSLFRTAAGEVGLDALSGTATVFGLRVAGTRKSYLYWENGTSTLTLAAEAASSSLKFLSANALALTLDASQNATFAGTITASGNISSNAVFGSSSGTLYLRPNGISVASGQATIDTSGNATFAGKAILDGVNSVLVVKGANPTLVASSTIVDYASGSRIISYGSTTGTAAGFSFIGLSSNGSVGGTRFSIDSAGDASLAGTIATQGGTASTPANAFATGTAGTIRWDASYIYVCTAANTWKRVAIAAW